MVIFQFSVLQKRLEIDYVCEIQCMYNQLISINENLKFEIEKITNFLNTISMCYITAFTMDGHACGH